ncbi:MAG TPA: hypothetical protein PLS10_08490 [Chitinophagales bacterium]|nr:hypothetical protein [Chitinophagales bacterium]
MSTNKGKLLDMEMYPSAKLDFYAGNVVRSYRSNFNEDKPIDNCYLEGIVINVENHKEDVRTFLDKITVKWYKHVVFGVEHLYSGLPHNNEKIWEISTASPHLIKTSNQLNINL